MTKREDSIQPWTDYNIYMNVQLQIIKGLLNKEAYEKYAHLVSLDVTLKDHYTLLCSMHESIDRDISLDEFILRADQLGLKYLNEIQDVEVGHETCLELIRINSERSFCHRLGLVCMEAFEGRKTLSDVSELYTQMEQLEKQDEIEFVSRDLVSLYEEVKREGGIQWRLKWLNDTIGGLHDGTFGFVFARTNVGKTTFLASEVSYFLKQFGKERKLLWINNEEGGARILFRVVQSYFGIDEEKLENNLQKVSDRFNEETDFYLKNMGFSHRKDIENVIKTLQPSLIVIDSLDAVTGFKAERQDLVFSSIYQWARRLSQEYAPVIGVCQAGATAENKRWLDTKDIDSAHTAKPKHADFVIGIGKRDDVGMEDIRFLSQVKNKFKFGDHKEQFRLNYNIARYEEIT